MGIKKNTMAKTKRSNTADVTAEINGKQVKIGVVYFDDAGRPTQCVILYKGLEVTIEKWIHKRISSRMVGK